MTNKENGQTNNIPEGASGKINDFDSPDLNTLDEAYTRTLLAPGVRSKQSVLQIILKQMEKIITDKIDALKSSKETGSEYYRAKQEFDLSLEKLVQFIGGHSGQENVRSMAERIIQKINKSTLIDKSSFINGIHAAAEQSAGIHEEHE